MNVYIVDSFTKEAFSGNPAGVCILDKPVSVEWMQKVSRELNLSETAFLLREEDNFSLRWFTPTVEVDLCGHGTLASAHILWEQNICKKEDTIRFNTRSGRLTATRKMDFIELNFPEEPEEESEAPEALIEALKVTPKYVGKNRMDYVIEVDTEEEVKNLNPDFSMLSKVKARGVIVTSKSSMIDIDFVSRCFFPAIGIDEDPVTGSAHCLLGPFWQKKFYKNELKAVQLSERQGFLKVKMTEGRVLIAGQAVTVLSGNVLEEQQV